MDSFDTGIETLVTSSQVFAVKVLIAASRNQSELTIFYRKGNQKTV